MAQSFQPWFRMVLNRPSASYPSPALFIGSTAGVRANTRRFAGQLLSGTWLWLRAGAPPAPARLRVLKKPDDVAVGVFDGCDQPSATDILLSVQSLDP